MLTTVLDDKPDNAADKLESMSAMFKTSRMRTELNFKEVPDPGQNAGQARAEWNLFKVKNTILLIHTHDHKNALCLIQPF